MKTKFLYISFFIFLIINCSIYNNPSNLLLITINDQYGFINKNGNIMISPQFEIAYDFSEGYSAVKKSGLWGFINTNGEYIILPKYKQVNSFSEGYAYVRLEDGSRNFVDKNGILLTDIYLEGAKNFYNGAAFVYKNEKFGVMNSKGVMITDFIFEHSILTGYGSGPDAVKFHPYGFYNDRAPVCVEGKYGYISNNGSKITEYVYDFVEYFRDGLAKVKKENKYGIIDLNGNYIALPEYESISKLLGSYIAVKKVNKWGYIDREGIEIVSAKFDYAESFNSGCGLVGKKDSTGKVRYGFIDKTGKIIIDIRYDKAYTFDDDGYTIVELDNKSTLIDKTGKYLFPLRENIKFDALEGYTIYDIDFYHDFIIDNRIIFKNTQNGKYGFMTIEGKQVTDSIYYMVKHFSNNIAEVQLGNSSQSVKTGYINLNGDYIWEPTR